jgi:hypothetical protein
MHLRTETSWPSGRPTRVATRAVRRSTSKRVVRRQESTKSCGVLREKAHRTKWRAWQGASAADWDRAREREAVIGPLVEQQRLTKAAVASACAQLGLSRTSVYELVQRYRRRPQTSSLFPLKRGRDPKTRFLDRDRETLIAASIEEYYLTPQKPSVWTRNGQIGGLAECRSR